MNLRRRLPNLRAGIRRASSMDHLSDMSCERTELGNTRESEHLNMSGRQSDQDVEHCDDHTAQRSIARYRRIRPVLKLLIAVGFLLLPIGPIARVGNEGFGDAPGPIEVSSYWQQMSHVLIPLGISLIVLAGIALVVVDRRR